MRSGRLSQLTLALLAGALVAGGCGNGASDALKEARDSIEAAARLTERAVKDEKISEKEARRICRTAATGIPDEAVAEDSIEICVDATLDSQKALRKIDEKELEEQLEGLEGPLP